MPDLVQNLGELDVLMHLASVPLEKLDFVLPQMELRVLEDEGVEFVELLFEIVDRLDQFRQQMQPGLHFWLAIFLREQLHIWFGGLKDFTLLRLYDLEFGAFIFSFLLAAVAIHYRQMILVFGNDFSNSLKRPAAVY